VSPGGDDALAILPNGESVRPGDVVGIVFEPAARLYDSDVQRFDVVALGADGGRRTLAKGLLATAARRAARAAAAAVNDASARRPPSG